MKKKTKKTNINRVNVSAQTPSRKPGGVPEKQKILDRAVELGILFLLGVSPLVFLRIGGEFENNPKMGFLQWGIAVLAIIKALRIKKSGMFNWKTTPFDLPIIFFYGFCLLSLLQALNPWQATLSLLHWGAAIIFYFVLVNSIKREETVCNIFFVTAISVCLVSIIGILQKLQIDTPFLHVADIPQLTPPSSTFSNKNMASQFVALAIPLTIGSVFVSRQVWMKVISAVSLILSIMYLICAETRSAWVACIVVVSLLLTVYFFPNFLLGVKNCLSVKKVFCTAVAAVFVFALLWLSPARESMQRAPDRYLKGSWKLRAAWWLNTVEMAKDNLMFGVGVGNFKINYPPYYRAIEKDWGFRDWSFSEGKQVNRVHNDHLQMLVELGVFGFAAYVAMFFVFFYIFMKIYFRQENDRRKLMALFLCMGVVSFLIIAFLTFPMERAMPPIYLFMFFGLTGFLYAEDNPKNRQISSPGLQTGVRILISILLAVYLCSSFYFIRKIVLSDKYFVEALALGESGNINQANISLKKAEDAFFMWNFNITALLARNYTMQGDYEKAIDEYRKSFSAHPYNTNAMLNTGYCYLKLKKYDEAEKYFKKFIEIIPDSAKVHNNLGIVCYSKKDFDSAVAYYKKACELDINYAEPHFNLANLYRLQGRMQDAAAEYETALNLKPGMDDVRRLLSSLYMKTGNYKKAREVIAPLLETQNRAAEDLVMQADILQQQGNHKEAIELYSKALRLSPDNAFIYHNIGLSCYYLKDYSKAEKAFKTAVSLNPNIADTYNLLGQLYLRKKDDTEALKYFLRALEINPDLRDAHYNVATTYLRLGKYELAAEEYKITLKIDPGLSLAHYNLATILRHQGKGEEAVIHFEKSLENPSKRIDVSLVKKFITELKQGQQR